MNAYIFYHIFLHVSVRTALSSVRISHHPAQNYLLFTRLLQCLFISNGRYIDYLSLTYATNEGKILKLHYKYYRGADKSVARPTCRYILFDV